MKLNELYEDMYDIEGEALSQWIDQDDLDYDFPIHIYDVDDLKILTTNAGDMSVFDAYNEYADEEQKELVAEYSNSKLIDEDPIIVAGNTLLDGYHRCVASILSNQSIRAINIYDKE